MADPLPTASQFFGLPDTAFAQAPPPPPAPPTPPSGEAQNAWWSAPGNPLATILFGVGYPAVQSKVGKATVAGVQEGFGSQPLGLDPDTESNLRKAGILPDYQKGQTSWLNAASDVLIRGGIQFADLAGRIPSAVLGGVQAGAEEAREETAVPHPNIGQQAIGAVAGATISGIDYLRAGGGAELGFGLPMEAAVRASAAERATQVTAARSLGVVGEGEEGFYDAKPLTPEAATARTTAAQEAGVEPTPPAPPPVDVHELARRIDPDTFEQYDAWSLARDFHRDTLARLSAEREQLPEAIEAQTQIETILDRVNNVPSRLTNAATARLTAAQDRLDTILHTDTPEMTVARNALMDADYKMREVAPEVSAAYRQAREMNPDLPESAAQVAEQPKGAEEAEAKGAPPQAAEEVAEQKTEAEVQQRAVAAAGAAPEAQAGVAPAQVTGEETLGATGVPEGGGAPEGARLSQARYGNLRAVQGTGETVTRGLAKGVEANAIERGLTNDFGDLPEYQRLSMADQAAQAAELINRDYDAAKDVAMGLKQPPKGLLPESVFVGVEKRALAEGDVETLRQLATGSRLNTAATTMGQRIRTLGERDPTSPVGLIQQIAQAREAAYGSGLDAAKRQAADEIKASMRETSSSAQAWTNLVQSLLCEE